MIGENCHVNLPSILTSLSIDFICQTPRYHSRSLCQLFHRHLSQLIIRSIVVIILPFSLTIVFVTDIVPDIALYIVFAQTWK